MSFKAVLLVQGESFAVRNFHWAVSQHTDALGRPEARVQGGTLEIELDAPPSEMLTHWATNDTKRHDGVVNVYEADSASVRDEVKFFDAYCVQFNKHFQDAHAAAGMTLRLTLSANKLQYAEVEVDNRWPDVAG